MKTRIIVIAMMVLVVSIAAPRVNAQQISDKEAKTLLNSAKTPADHQKLADYFAQETNRLTAEAAKHEAEVPGREKNPEYFAVKNPQGFGAQHCRDAASRLRRDAAQTQLQAEQHADMAAQVVK